VTSYTDLGAREYDPQLGRFLSVDPVLELDDPTQLGGYDYAGNDPVTKSDPSGLRLDPGYGGLGEPAHPQTPAQHKSRHPPGSQPGNGGHHDVGPALHADSTPQSRFLDYLDTLNNAYTIPKPPVRHSHWWKSPTAMDAAILGVGLFDVVQGGLDPVSDGAELALIAERTAVATEEAATAAAEGEGTTLLRGVASDHHVFQEAMNGEAWPGDMLGHQNGAWHAAGITEDSSLTSWTTDRAVAERFATNEGQTNGVILRTTLEEQVGRVVPGPNNLGESEVLLRGVIRGLPVELIP
jgi:hypothetical protein